MFHPSAKINLYLSPDTDHVVVYNCETAQEFKISLQKILSGEYESIPETPKPEFKSYPKRDHVRGILIEAPFLKTIDIPEDDWLALRQELDDWMTTNRGFISRYPIETQGERVIIYMGVEIRVTGDEQ